MAPHPYQSCGPRAGVDMPTAFEASTEEETEAAPAAGVARRLAPALLAALIFAAVGCAASFAPPGGTHTPEVARVGIDVQGLGGKSMHRRPVEEGGDAQGLPGEIPRVVSLNGRTYNTDDATDAAAALEATMAMMMDAAARGGSPETKKALDGVARTQRELVRTRGRDPA
eukprot:CAMPEP_0197930036 /NCGR_PEP_ID=MMETSP1439-20131203/104831_1 /TAXON_ID=66791 /ORGANISM="Gonyaulax spinifera, Strain CCMP409" /LENGTH=169 /DNA_ID=CAMNT_0043552711 /DNA_START=22 /DNA_END=531 /DNA_ORIENTATION=-